MSRRERMKNCSEILTSFSSYFLNATAVREIVKDSNYKVNNKDYKPSEDVDVGDTCASILQNLQKTDKLEIRENCLKFYTTALTEIQKSFFLNDNVLHSLNFLQPANALSNECWSENLNVEQCLERFFSYSDVNYELLKKETALLPSYFVNDEAELCQLEVDVFWKKIVSVRSKNGDLLFPNLKIFVQAVLTLPNSNAEPERIFSIVTDVKRKKGIKWKSIQLQ